MKPQEKANLFALCMLVAGLSACHGSTEQDSEQGNGVTINGEEVQVLPSSPVLSKIKVQTVTKGDYTLQFTTTATVEPISGQLAEVSVPFEGRISRSYIRLGQHVSKGAALFEVSSSDYLEAVKAFLSAKQGKYLTEKNYLRKKDLSEHGVVSAKEFEEAEADYRIAEKEYEKAAATLKIYGTQGNDVDLGRPMVVRSPISGEVVKTNMVVGQYLKADAPAAVTVADLDKVWVVARVKEKNIGSIRQNDEVQVIAESLPDNPIRGRVDYIGSMMDEQTRSVDVYISCSNSGKLLKPGMFVTTGFASRQHDAIVVPSAAVMQQENKSYVYVRISKNRYVRREVEVSSAGNDRQVVHAGLQNGSSVVVEGGIYLQ